MKYEIILKKLREKMLCSQTELAKILGVSYPSINRWENGKATPIYSARRKIKELCEEYNIKIEGGME